MILGRLAVVIALAAVSACGAGGTAPPETPSAPRELTGFRLDGNPEAASGATWTYRATVDGVPYDLQGILYKPAGSGPFPAVVISHGAGGNANGYSRSVATTMVRWGLVAIATNYTHAAGVPFGAPGGALDLGASQANVQRAHKLVDILGSFGYVDRRRLAAHGHSMGAFVTAAVMGAHPESFLAASHTAGGVRPESPTLLDGATPTELQASTIRAPYQMHHGDADVVVALSADQRLAALLSTRGVTHQLVVYPGAGHNEVATSAVVLERVRAWYTTHKLF
jgi:dienelactone hydrolase